jgi:FkbM family methyltransferase
MNLFNNLFDINNLNNEIRLKVLDFVSTENKMKRFLYGRNKYSAELANIIEIDGFIDDFTVIKTWNNKQVYKINEVPRDSLVVNCTFSISPVTLSKRIDEFFPNGALEYSNLLSVFPYFIPVPDFIKEQQSDFLSNKIKYLNLYNALSDEPSKQLFIDLMRYRCTGDIANMNLYSIRPTEQYFEDFLNLPKDPVFIDGGGFDGDTTELFCKNYPQYRKVYLFEPSIINISKAKSRLKEYYNIVFIEKAISDKNEILNFNGESGMMSSVASNGGSTVIATTIDDEVKEKVSFIKMDLEGWDLNALIGAKSHIINDHPNLAIAVYHKTNHLWKIYDFVMSIRKDYKIFLRQYTEGNSETIMYFIPNKIV